MKYLKSFNESADLSDLSTRISGTRTKSISSEEFLEILNNSCKNFSFENDQLWRNSGSFGNFGLFFEAERKGTIGTYNYKTFFDLRKEYPVPRYKSLIGSTTLKGANYFGSGSKNYLVIPFDNSQIVFAGSPDLAIWSKVDQEFTDDLFIMKEYDKNFKVPQLELESIRNSSKLSSWTKLPEFGFEFFTTSPCLLIHESQVDWLRGSI